MGDGNQRPDNRAIMSFILEGLSFNLAMLIFILVGLSFILAMLIFHEEGLLIPWGSRPSFKPGQAISSVLQRSPIRPRSFPNTLFIMLSRDKKERTGGFLVPNSSKRARISGLPPTDIPCRRTLSASDFCAAMT